MARPLRIQYPGAIYHVTSRGNARQPIVECDTDRRSFLGVLAIVVDQYRWTCHAYCLMTNHYHLLIETPEENLSQGMRQLNGVYTQRFNRRYDRVGHLFQGRFHAVLVQRDRHLLDVCRYIELNPVEAHLVERPQDHQWSRFTIQDLTPLRFDTPAARSVENSLDSPGRADAMKLSAERKLFLGFKVDAAMKRQIDSGDTRGRPSFKDGDPAHLQILEERDGLYIGRVLEPGFAIEQIDDLKRNIRSILGITFPDHKPQGSLRLFAIDEDTVDKIAAAG